MELRLGTVQFGMNYGIRGQSKPSKRDAISIMDYAVEHGICAFDTARAYGDAELILGEFLKLKNIERENLNISTKLEPNILDNIDLSEYKNVIIRELQKQLSFLGTDYVDVYVYHSAKYALDERKLEALSVVKEKGLSRLVGVSLYEPMEALACMNSPYIDFMQIPYSIFDQRMKESGVIDQARVTATINFNDEDYKKKFDRDSYNGCYIDARSTLLQGLIVMNERDVPDYLSDSIPIIRKISDICKKNDVSRVQLALQFVKKEKKISHLVFGVDSIDQLKENIKFFNDDLPKSMLNRLGDEFKGIKSDIVIPSLWKR